jgi:uncharacterized protein YunC (DUF1805 family)
MKRYWGCGAVPMPTVNTYPSSASAVTGTETLDLLLFSPTVARRTSRVRPLLQRLAHLDVGP